jgi:hypothetical protein
VQASRTGERLQERRNGRIEADPALAVDVTAVGEDDGVDALGQGTQFVGRGGDALTTSTPSGSRPRARSTSRV